MTPSWVNKKLAKSPRQMTLAKESSGDEKSRLVELFEPPLEDVLPKQQSFAHKFDSLNLSSNSFAVHEKLGEGSYGAVYRCTHKDSGLVVALKFVDIDEDEEAFKSECSKEVDIMRRLDNHFVIRYYGSFAAQKEIGGFQQDQLCIAMEYCQAGSTLDLMRTTQLPLSVTCIQIVLSQVVAGLVYLHSQNLIHRDLKAGNVLCNVQGHVKLADFGVSGSLDDVTRRHSVIGSPYWMAPEVIREIGYNTKADIWSLGITAIEMDETRPPRSTMHPMKLMLVIPTLDAPVATSESEELNDFVSKCCVLDPAHRCSAADLLDHPFVLDIDQMDKTELINQVKYVMWKAEQDDAPVEEDSLEYDSEDVVNALAALNFDSVLVKNDDEGDTGEDDAKYDTFVVNTIRGDPSTAAGRPSTTFVTLRGGGLNTRVSLRSTRGSSLRPALQRNLKEAEEKLAEKVRARAAFEARADAILSPREKRERQKFIQAQEKLANDLRLKAALGGGALDSSSLSSPSKSKLSPRRALFRGKK